MKGQWKGIVSIPIPVSLPAARGERKAGISLGTLAAVLLALLAGTCPFAVAGNDSARTSYPTTPITGFVHDAWRNSDGLPQNSVQAILQTHDGYLWLGTQEGLVRFDGVTFTVFDRHNTPSLRLSDIRALAEDGSGALWIGMNGGGLSRLKDGKFTGYSVQEGLSNSFVSSLQLDREGNLWIGTEGGISRWKDGKFTSYTVRDGLADNFVSSICEDHEGQLWVGTNRGLSRLVGGKFATYAIPGLRPAVVESIHEDRSGNLWIGTDRELIRLRDGKSTSYTEKDGIPEGSVTFIGEDHDGNLWVGTASGGALRLRDGKFSSYSMREGLTNNSVLSIYQDREGSIWIGTNGGGLNRLRRGAFKTYDEAAGLSSSSVMSIYQSWDGSLWIGMDGGGLDQLKDGKVTVYRSHDGLSNETIRSIYEDREGSLWLGTEGGGVSQLRNGKFRAYSTRDGLSNDSIRSVYGDHEGNIWIGTYGGGLSRLRNGKFSTYTIREGLPSDTVWVVYEDRSNNLWVGTNGGLAEFRDGRFRNVEDAKEPGATAASSPVLSLYQDPNDALWIGTLSGLRRLKDGKFTTYTIADGLFDDLIYTILEDGRGYLWMSSNRGIFRVSKQELEDFAAGKIRAVTSVAYGLADGMKNPECNGGSQPAGWKTKEGKLLFANLGGLVEVDPGHIESNPLPPPVVIERAIINQKLYDPGALIQVPPGRGELEINYTALSFLAPQRMGFKYRLEGFDSQWVNAGTRRTAYYTNIPPGSYRFRVIASNNDGLWNQVGAALDLQLRPHFYQTYDIYGLSAVLLGLTIFGLHRLRVASLRARERKLHLLVGQRTEQLRHSEAGLKKRTVELQATNDKLQSEMTERERAEEAIQRLNQDLEQRVIERTAELQGTNDKLQSEMTVRKQAEEELRALNHELEAFTYSVSHDLRAPLRHIDGFSGIVLEEAGPKVDEETRHYLERIREGSQQMGRLIDDLLKLSRIGRQDLTLQVAGLNRVVEKVVRELKPEIQGREIKFNVGRLPFVECDPTLMESVFMNLLSNAVKFTRTREQAVIEVGQVGVNGNTAFYVRDNGVGFSMKYANKLFGVFQRLHRQEDFEGTGVGLATVQRIVRKHKGDIWAEAEPDKGATFYFTLGMPKNAACETSSATVERS